MKRHNLTRHCFLLLTLTFLTACAPSIPRSELQNLPPLVEIISLDLQDKKITLRVSNRNTTTRKNNVLSCDINIVKLNPIKIESITIPDLTNYAKETINIDLSSSIGSEHQLSPSMNYELDCQVSSEKFQNVQILKQGKLFKIPGTIAEYR